MSDVSELQFCKDIFYNLIFKIKSNALFSHHSYLISQTLMYNGNKPSQRECGAAEGHTTPLAFRAALQVLSCCLTMDKGTQSQLPGAVWSPAQRWEEQSCVSTAKSCVGITRTCLTHTGWGSARDFPPEILPGMTSLLMTN